jgi:Zn-dependent protease
MEGRDLILFLPVLLFSVVLHEYAHGWQARREGDDTAYMLGRLTLNPVPHIDLFGSILLPLMLVLMRSSFLIGWAKPVPVNPRKYRNYRGGDIRVSLAGIVVNLLLALAGTLLLIILLNVQRFIPGAASVIDILARMAQYGVLINLVLAFFNLIPIPPLDGSHVLYHLLPPQMGAAYRRLNQYGMLILVAVMFFARPLFGLLMSPAFYLYSVAMTMVSIWT